MKKTWKISYIIETMILLLCLTEPTMAQMNENLKGRVTDESDGAIENVVVIVRGKSKNYQTVSNENGEYALVLPEGAYKISTRKVVGFKPFKEKVIKLISGQILYHNMKLKFDLKDADCLLIVTSSSNKFSKLKRKKK